MAIKRDVRAVFRDVVVMRFVFFGFFKHSVILGVKDLSAVYSNIQASARCDLKTF